MKAQACQTGPSLGSMACRPTRPMAYLPIPCGMLARHLPQPRFHNAHSPSPQQHSRKAHWPLIFSSSCGPHRHLSLFFFSSTPICSANRHQSARKLHAHCMFAQLFPQQTRFLLCHLPQRTLANLDAQDASTAAVMPSYRVFSSC